ncbi:hypothetical protein GCM10009092_13030 [Bowmanella denitrificans]|uniref:Uncharacterized protein n=1 Tax=Bowmanella denitrificans TaxID=366582 RepID=A0ABN0WY25_9ALTE
MRARMRNTKIRKVLSPAVSVLMVAAARGINQRVVYAKGVGVPLLPSALLATNVQIADIIRVF